MNTKRCVAVLSVLFLLAAGSLFAQTPRTLNVGSQISASIRAGEDHWYSVRAAGSGMLVVETFGGEVDTYLEAYDASRNLIAEDDDGGEGLNARVEIFAEAGQT